MLGGAGQGPAGRSLEAAQAQQAASSDQNQSAQIQTQIQSEARKTDSNQARMGLLPPAVAAQGSEGSPSFPAAELQP